MHIALVSFYPRQKGRLSEYASMLASEWDKEAEISVICQKNPAPEPVNDENILPTFNREKFLYPLSVLQEIKQVNPDIVVFNQYIGVWGDRKTDNFVGMSLPFLTKKILRKPTFTILHNTHKEIKLDEVERVEKNLAVEKGLEIGTRLLLKGSVLTSVTLESYRKRLEEEYGADLVNVPHGKPVNDFLYTKPGEEFNILAFGHWGPNKGLELLLESAKYFDNDAELIIAGKSHPDHPEYLEETRSGYEKDAEFTGFVPEKDLDRIFSKADLVVLPYKAFFGTSGVLNLAMGYGVPPLVTRNDDTETILEEEDAEAILVEPEPRKIGEKVNQLKEEESRLKHIARKNYTAAEKNSFEEIGQEYIDLFREIV